MSKICTLQIFIDGRWRDAAAIDLTGDQARGIDASAYLAYSPGYALDYYGRNDAAALSASMPVSLDAGMHDAWPPFLVDLLPQGYGRKELLRQLNRSEAAERDADWELLRAGAGNPIGNVRVKEAHEWIMERSGGSNRGFTQEEVAARADDFNEYLAQHGLFLAGSSGVQGEWPKILLTRAHDGLFYLDHTLKDEDAAEHFIVKFGRGPDPRLAEILRLEEPYMRLARHLGLNVHKQLSLHGRALFIPRFDRSAANGQVIRHGQESAASFCGLTGFGVAPSHNEMCRRLGQVASDPVSELAEYIRRDMANVALGNKDNHGRNTAIQRRQDGTVGLTPLFDFAPMWLHPDGIARKMRWEADDGGSPLWSSVITQTAEAGGVAREALLARIRPMAARLGDVYALAIQMGIEEEPYLKPIAHSLAKVKEQAERL